MTNNFKVKEGENGTDAACQNTAKVSPPTSECSGETLRDVESPDNHADERGLSSLASAFDPENLNLDNLAIDNTGSTFAIDGVARYTTPFLRGLKSPVDSNRLSASPSDFVRKDTGFRMGSPSTNRFGGGGYRNSRRWVSPDAQATHDFIIVRNSMRRQFKKSEVAQWKYSDYIAHREAMIASKANQLAKKVKAKVEALEAGDAHTKLEIQQTLYRYGLLGNIDERGNLSRVLGEPTIWCRDWENGKSDIAPWPSTSEMKWEGDDRAKTGVGRFLPLPREYGGPDLPWNQLSCIEQFPLDQVACIPTMEDVYLPVDYYIEEHMEYLWSKDLEEAMDELLES